MALPTVKGIGGPPIEPLSEVDEKTGEPTNETSFEWKRWFTILYGAFPYVRTYTITWNPAAVAANTTAEQTVTVAGVATNDVVIVNKPTNTAGIGLGGARASASGQVAVTFVNPTAGSIDPGEEDYLFVAIRM